MAIEPPGTPQRRPDAPPVPASMRAGEPTALLPAARAAAQRSGAGSLWPRTLRWRLILTYALLLALTMVMLGVGLNLFIARALYATEFSFFQNEAVASVSASQNRFDTLTLGRAATCSDAIPYE
ncbi:MAG TPA: hypothetical protein VIC27_04420, partial [Ktedonobacterales bacterium]